MKRLLSLALIVPLSAAQYIIDGASFGHRQGISPTKYAIPNWHVSGRDWVPSLLSDRVVLTPPNPGNKQGALWTDSRLDHPEWTADLEFRSTGPERGGGNLQIWYTEENKDQITTNSIYTVGKFKGLALVIDMYGGREGGIRGFLNDGSTDYKNHPHLESLAFGHCDYAYRNLGRPSKVQLKQDSAGFEVSVDGNRCFRSDQVLLPASNYFGITASSAQTPDSFEVFKFVTVTSSSYTREEPNRNQAASPQPPPAQVERQPDDQYTTKQAASGQMQEVLTILRTLQRSVRDLQTKQEEISRLMATSSQAQSMDASLRKIDNALGQMRLDLNPKDYTGKFNEIHETLKSRHDTLLEILPESMGKVISSRGPRMGFFVFMIVLSQLLMAAIYVLYKRRRSGASKKYL